MKMNVGTLKKSLVANGLAQYGMNEQMRRRLLAGGIDKKKSGPNPQRTLSIPDLPAKNDKKNIKNEYARNPNTAVHPALMCSLPRGSL